MGQHEKHIKYIALIDCLLLCMSTWPTLERLRYTRDTLIEDFSRLARCSSTYKEDTRACVFLITFLEVNKEFQSTFYKVWMTGKYALENNNN